MPQDDAAAVSWYRRSADQGMPSAQYKLGLAYLGGVGVPKDALMSYVWLSLATAGGEGMDARELQRARRFRRSVESILDPLEVARGRQMVRDWQLTWEWRPRPAAPTPGSTPVATVIPFTPGRPIYVDARVNGRTPVRLVLDTGADSTVIAPDVLNAAGASVAGRTTLLGVTGQATVGIHDVTSLEIGNVKVGPLKVLAHNAADQAADGLLGRDFLERFTVTIDSAGGRVTLTRGRNSQTDLGSLSAASWHESSAQSPLASTAGRLAREACVGCCSREWPRALQLHRGLRWSLRP